MDVSHITSRQKTWFVWGLWLLVFGVFSAIFPRDVSFDVAHYQIHNGWSAVNNRSTIDLAAAEMHSFLNPAWQIFIWALIDNLPGRVVAFILGVLQGLILPVLYMFTTRLLRATGAQVPSGIVLAITATGFLAEAQFGLFASTRNDAVSALGFIFALTCLLPKDNRAGGPSYAALALASFTVGAIMGMKLTNAVYMVGFASAVFIIMPDWTSRLRAGIWCGLIGFLGIALIGGPWAWHLWHEFGNPIFPLFNEVFNAPLGPDVNFRDPRYGAISLGQSLIWPFIFLMDGSLIHEEKFLDPRFLMTYLVTSIFIISAFIQTKRKKFNLTLPILAVSTALLVSIFAWMFKFSIQRYMVAAWIVGPSFLACFICVFWPKSLSHTKALIPAVAACTLIIVTTQMSALRRVPWETLWQPYVRAELPQEFDFGNSIVLFSGDYPVAFISPAFPKSTILTNAVTPKWSAPVLDNYRPLIRQTIWESDKKLYALITITQANLPKTLTRLEKEEHLHGQKKACREVSTSFDTKGIKWVVCPLTRGDTRPN